MNRAIPKLIPENELRSFVTRVGIQQQDAMDPFTNRASHVAQIGVYLTPENLRERKTDAIINSIRDKLQAIANTQHIENLVFSTQRTGPPVGKPVAIRVMGDDLQKLRIAAEQVTALLSTIKGVSDITSSYIEGKQELRIKPDLTKTAQSLLSTQDIATHARASMEGQIATYINEDGDRIPVRVRYKESARNDENILRNSLLTNKQGYMVALNRVANFTKNEGIHVIKHRNSERIITVSAAIDEHITTSNSVNSSIAKPLTTIESKIGNVRLESGGEYEDTTKSMESLRNAFLFAMAMIFLILAAQFRSLTQPFVVMAAIPFGVIGVNRCFLCT